MTTPHPEEKKLLAIARGEQMQRNSPWAAEWCYCSADEALLTVFNFGWEHVRIAPATVIVNGVECPKNCDMYVDSSYCADTILVVRGSKTTSVYFETTEQRDQAEAATVKPWLG